MSSNTKTSKTSETSETSENTIDFNAVPEWVMPYIKTCVIHLGLNIWTITALCDNCPDPNNPSADACAEIRSRYYIATLRFKPQLIQTPSAPARALILHELLHVVNGPRDLQVNDLLGLLTSDKKDKIAKAQQDWAHSLYTNIDEQTVTRLSYALVDLIPYPTQTQTQTQTQTEETPLPTPPTETVFSSGSTDNEEPNWTQREQISRLHKRCPHLTYKEIAEVLILSSETVRKHLTSEKEKNA